jgi:hypothetical protein
MAGFRLSWRAIASAYKPTHYVPADILPVFAWNFLTVPFV